MEETARKCGNCGHLLPIKGTVAEKIWQAELTKGTCEMNGKKMRGSLVAGCFYWCDRKSEREHSKTMEH